MIKPHKGSTPKVKTAKHAPSAKKNRPEAENDGPPTKAKTPKVKKTKDK
jgi:hypothetical protein